MRQRRPHLPAVAGPGPLRRRTQIKIAIQAVAVAFLLALWAYDLPSACADEPNNQNNWLGIVAAQSRPAGDPPTTAPAAGQPAEAAPAADKSSYNLFHPVPADLMRPMDMDRPNITNTPHTVDAGHVQVETGLADYTHFRDKSAGGNVRSDAWSLGQFNFRTGLLNNLEFNVIVTAQEFLNSRDFVTGQSSHANGYGDTVLGGKLNFWGNEMGDKVWGTALGLQPQVTLPTSGHVLGTGWTEGQLNVPFLMNLPAGFHLGAMTSPVLERNAANTGYCAGWLNTVSVDRVFFDRYDVYVEYASHVTAQRHQEGQGSVDLGVIYTLSPNVALDTAVNIGTTKATAAIEWLAGVTVRF